MKKYTIACLFSFFATSLPGFTQEETASKILEASKTRLDAPSDFSAEVVISMVHPIEALPAPEKGIFHYAKGKYALILKNQEIYCDGNYIWLHLPSNNELTINHYDPEEGKGFEQVF